MRTVLGFLIAVAIATVASGSAQAAKIVFSGSNGAGWVSGSFDYDPSSTALETEADETRTYASYTPSRSLYNFSFTSSITNGVTTADDNYTIFINDFLPGTDGQVDTLNVFGFKQLFGSENAMFTFDLDFPDANALSSASLPTALNAGSARFSYTGPFDSLALPVTFAMASAVPEPATWAMLIAGFGMVGGIMRRRRRVDARSLLLA